MNIITMERKTQDGQPVYKEEIPIRDWWCVIETKEEEALYDMAMGNRKPLRMSEKNMPIDTLKIIWDDLICFAGEWAGVSWGDDDIYGYIRPDEMPPEIGDEFVDGDNDKWVRVE